MLFKMCSIIICLMKNLSKVRLDVIRQFAIFFSIFGIVIFHLKVFLFVGELKKNKLSFDDVISKR